MSAPSEPEFQSPADDYDRFMGRYTISLASALADVVDITDGMRLLDVGCGPGGLALELASRTPASNIAAIDPAEQFVAACKARMPEADVRAGFAESLPWEDDSFDAALSCLVIAFMSDPDAGVREMARVTKPGGKVAACMWDITGGNMTMLRMFWTALHAVVEEAPGEERRPGTQEGDIAERFERAGLAAVTSGVLTASAGYSDFDDFWEPMTLAVGPAGRALAKLDDASRDQVREKLRTAAPDGPFSLDAKAWYAIGTVA